MPRFVPRRRLTVLASLCTTALLISPALALRGAAPQLASVSLSASSVVAGSGSITGTLSLDSPAASPVSVQLRSSAPAAASVPATVSVGTGQRQAAFTVKIGEPTVATNVTITASYAGVSRSTRLAVQGVPAPRVMKAAVSPSTVQSPGSATATITLSRQAPTGGQIVALMYHPATIVTGPRTVTVPAGSAAATVQISVGSVSSQTGAFMRALIKQDGMTATFTIKAAAGSCTLEQVSVRPSPLHGGETGSLSVRLSGPAPSSGVNVSLTCSDTRALRVPASVRVPAGQAGASVSVTGQAVDGDRSVRITATASEVSKATSVTVLGRKAP